MDYSQLVHNVNVKSLKRINIRFIFYYFVKICIMGFNISWSFKTAVAHSRKSISFNRTLLMSDVEK